MDLRLTTIEPVDIRGAIYADDTQAKTVWFPPEFLPTADQPAGILFLDELTAADQRLQISAYSLILDRRVGHYRLPDGWQVVAAGNASFHGAVCHDMGTALADRMFHFNVQTVIDAFLDHALARGFAPEVMAYLKVRPDKLDDTQAQLAADHLVGASPRGWEDVSNVLKSGLSDERAARLRAGPHRRGQRGRILRRAARAAGRGGRGGACWPPRPGPRPRPCCRARWTGCTAWSTACWRHGQATRRRWRARWRSSSSCPTARGARCRCRCARRRRWRWSC